MRKFIIIAVLMYSFKLCANPVELPPVISEFYYNGGDWQIEAYFDEIYQAIFTDFSELTLISNTDTAYFVAGLNIEYNTTMVITQDDLISPFFIDPTEDWISFSTLSFHQFGIGISYGGSRVTTPKAGESVVNQHFYFYNYGDGTYHRMKDSSPTIGSDPFECDSRGSFSGYVFDQYSNPVEGVKLAYVPEEWCYYLIPNYSCIQTDENGYFETDGLFCNRHIFELEKDGNVFMSDTMFIEPDSSYYREYNLISVGIPQNELYNEINMTVAPNPFSNKTTFHLTIPADFQWQDARITIRDINGRIVDFIPIISAPWGGNEIHMDWHTGNDKRPVPAGLYIYSLEVDGSIMLSNKMIITK